MRVTFKITWTEDIDDKEVCGEVMEFERDPLEFAMWRDLDPDHVTTTVISSQSSLPEKTKTPKKKGKRKNGK